MYQNKFSKTLVSLLFIIGIGTFITCRTLVLDVFIVKVCLML